MTDSFMKCMDNATAIEIALIHKGKEHDLDRMKKVIQMLTQLSETKSSDNSSHIEVLG